MAGVQIIAAVNGRKAANGQRRYLIAALHVRRKYIRKVDAKNTAARAQARADELLMVGGVSELELIQQVWTYGRGNRQTIAVPIAVL